MKSLQFYGLEDNEWKACGYTIEKADNNQYRLSREPLRRFEDLENSNTIELLSVEEDKYNDEIIKIISNIKTNNKSVVPDDICIIYIGSYKRVCEHSDDINRKIFNKFKWNCTKGYETKRKGDEYCIY